MQNFCIVYKMYTWFLCGNPSSCFETISPFISKDTKFKLLLCILIVLSTSRNVSLEDSNHILNFFMEGFENLPLIFFNPKNLSLSIEQSMWLHLYFLSRKFQPDICNNIANNDGNDLSTCSRFRYCKDHFAWNHIFNLSGSL